MTVSIAPAWSDPRHLRGTIGAADVDTHQRKVIRKALAACMRVRDPLAVFGPNGLGKTSATLTACMDLEVPWHYLDAPLYPKGNALPLALCQVFDPAISKKLRRRELEEFLLTAFAQGPQVFAIDEVDRLGDLGIEYLRYFLSQGTNRTTFVLIGYKLEKFLTDNPAMDSRVARRVEFRPLTGKDLLETLHAYHPRLAATDSALLLEMDRRIGKGVFRRWARILEVSLELAPNSRVIDERLARAIYGAVGK